jgi:hypothetical protein
MRLCAVYGAINAKKKSGGGVLCENPNGNLFMAFFLGVFFGK